MRPIVSSAALVFALALLGCADSLPSTPFSGAPSLAEEAVGTSQSPIDIRAEDLLNVGKQGLPALKFRYSSRADLSVVNTGSPDEEATIRAELPPGDGELRVGHETFRLAQFHFHTPSEHRIDGHAFPLEMHLVHQNGGGILVVGVLVREGEAHATLGQIFDDLPKHPGDRKPIPEFDLAGILPHQLESVRYSGSLTTDPYTEPVAWVVLDQPIEMSVAQIDHFRELFEEGNSREPQPLNGRTVATDADGKGRN